MKFDSIIVEHLVFLRKYAGKETEMKRVLTLSILILIIAASAFAQSIVEVADSSGPVVDLGTGKSTSSLVDTAFDESGNLEVTYGGTDPITITFTGMLQGSLIVRSDNADYTLEFNQAGIWGSTLPAIQLKSTTTATIKAAPGTTNVISDSSENTKSGVITASGNIILDGTDSSGLDIYAYRKNGIKTDGGVTVNGGDTIIYGDQLAEGNMINADMFFKMNGGTLRILAYGDVHGSESKGIKVSGVEGAGAGLGYVEINDGLLAIQSVDKGITAAWKQSSAQTEDTSDDPNPNVYINGGYVTVFTTGTPYEYSDDESLSPEGIEAKNQLYINGGVVYLFTTDDSLNAGKDIIINDGYVVALASENDAIDSNGTIEINGGTVIAMSSSREQAFDCDNDKNFTYTGGTFVGAGNGNNMPNSEKTTGYSIAYGDSTFYAGDQIAVLDSEGKVVIGFVVPYEVDSLTSIVFGSEDFKQGETYVISTGAYASQPDFMATNGSEFRARQSLVSMEITDHAVSKGYIGMNIGGDGATPPDMPAGFQDKGFGGRADVGQILQMLVRNSAGTELPPEVTINGDLDSEEAIQAMLYLLGNYVDFEDFMALFQGSMENGEFEMPQGMPGDMTPPQGGPFRN